MFLLFGSTVVVKIKKTQESTPSVLKRITEDKENIILLPVVSPLSPQLAWLNTNARIPKLLSPRHEGALASGSVGTLPDVPREVLQV